MPMTIVSSDKVFLVKPPASPDYKPNNPLGACPSILQLRGFKRNRTGT